MNAQEFDAAISAMAAENLDIDERRHFEEMRARYDTPDKQRGRKQRERERWKAAARKAGFDSVAQLCNAINSDEVEVIKRKN